MEIWFSLATRAAIKVAVFLWYHQDIRRLTDSYSHMRKEVLAQLECLSLPEPSKQLVANVIDPIGKHITFWIKNQKGKLNHMNLPQVLCWKSLGTIDCRKTAEKVIRSGIVDNITCFQLACSNCIESHVNRLWTTYGCDQLHTIYPDHFEFILSAEEKEFSFWISYLSRCMRQYNDPFEYGFRLGFELNKEEFCHYFLNKLSEPKRSDILVQALRTLLDKECNLFNADIFCLVVSELNYTETQSVFIENPKWLLCLLLEWPLQDYFLKVSDRVRDFIGMEGYFSVLLALSKKMLNCAHNKVYERIFETFWRNGTKDHRYYVLTEWIWDKFFNHAFATSIMERCLRRSNFAANLCQALSNNGILVLEVLTASCILDVLESITGKCMTEDPLINCVQNAIVMLRLGHKCELYCYPERFDHYLNLQDDDW